MPFHCSPRRLSYAGKEELKKFLTKLTKEKRIRESNSEYSPIVLVEKKNVEMRMCVDYRISNEYLLRNNYPLLLIEDQIDVLKGKQYFSLLDIKDGFYHIGMAEESIKFTSFVTQLGHFEFLLMPFGLKVAPNVFQKFVNTALNELIESGDIVVYMDDILVATDTLEHHFTVFKKGFPIVCVE